MNQKEIELLYSQRETVRMIKEVFQSNVETAEMLSTGINLVLEWASTESAYASKATRKELALEMDIETVVMGIITSVIRNSFTTFTNIVMSVVHLMPMEKRAGIVLAAELVTILRLMGVYKLIKKEDSWYVQCSLGIPDEIINQARRSTYLPPMIEKPLPLTHNRSTPYQSFESESLILGNKFNFHRGNICLDVLNKQNSIPLEINKDFCTSIQESMPVFKDKYTNKPLIGKERKEAEANWIKGQNQTEEFLNLLGSETLYFGNKVDKRGRIYTSGYHLSPQGTSYKKASLDLAKKEVINIPKEYL